MILKDYNWFKIKANCKYFFEITNFDNLKEHVLFAKTHNLKIFILGDGSNILLNENLDNYYILKPVCDKIILNGDIVNVSSGCSLKKFIYYCIKNNLEGMENFSGIPGNLGGCIFMNIHYKKYYISDYIESVNVFDISLMKHIKLYKKDINFNYTNNILKNNNYIILDAEFKFNKCSSNDHLIKKRNEILKIRTKKYPSSNTCGCFFYNIKELDSINKSIGYQIEKLNLNFNKFKNVKPSNNHKNIFVTNNNCTSNEIIKLANYISLELINKINYKPKAECRLIGFDDNNIEFSV